MSRARRRHTLAPASFETWQGSRPRGVGCGCRPAPIRAAHVQIAPHRRMLRYVASVHSTESPTRQHAAQATRLSKAGRHRRLLGSSRFWYSVSQVACFKVCVRKVYWVVYAIQTWNVKVLRGFYCGVAETTRVQSRKLRNPATVRVRCRVPNHVPPRSSLLRPRSLQSWASRSSTWRS